MRTKRKKIKEKFDEDNLINLTEIIKDEIDALPGITYTTLVGKKSREIEIEISEQTLQICGIQLQRSKCMILCNGNLPDDTPNDMTRAGDVINGSLWHSSGFRSLGQELAQQQGYGLEESQREILLHP